MVKTLVFLLKQPHLLAQPCDLAEERRCIEFCNCAGAEDISSPMARRHKCSPAPVQVSHCVCWRSNGRLNGRCLTLEPGQDTGTLLPCLAGEAGEGARCPQHVRRLARQLTSCSILQHHSLPALTPRLRKTSLLICRDRHPLGIPGPKSLHLWAGGQIWPTWEPQQATIWPGTLQAGMYGRGFLHTTKQAGSLLKPGI